MSDQANIIFPSLQLENNDKPLKFLKPQIHEISPNVSYNNNDFEFIITTPEDVAEAKRTEAARPKKTRMKPTPHQLARLNQVFAVNRSPDTITRNQLAEELLMNPRSVQIWFQNKRAKYKKVCLGTDKFVCHSPKSPESDSFPSSLSLLDAPTSTCNLETDLEMYAQSSSSIDLPSPKPTPRLQLDPGLSSNMTHFNNMDFFSLAGIYPSASVHRRSSLIPTRPAKFNDIQMSSRRNSEPMIQRMSPLSAPSLPMFIPQSDFHDNSDRGNPNLSFPSSFPSCFNK